MHELSLVRNIFATLEEQLSPEELAAVQAVELKIGLLSNVEPTLLQNAFLAYQESHPNYLGVELRPEMIPIRIHCPSCGLESGVEHYVFKCAHCGSPSNQIVSGEELTISRIYFAEEGLPAP